MSVLGQRERHGALRKLSSILQGLFAVLVTTQGIAAEIDITARFLPSAGNPNINRFENTTPVSGYCRVRPERCAQGVFSISIPNRTNYIPIIIGQGPAISVPRYWREVDITHADGSSQKVRMRVTGLGARYQLSNSISEIGISIHQDALWWGGGWLNPPTGCGSTGHALGGQWSYEFFWFFPTEGSCTKIARLNVTPGFYFTGLNFMYEMETPDPLAMSMGTYTGEVTYTIGPNGDFKFGDATAIDPILNINLRLSVQHTLRVLFPPASDRLVLQPHGGWQQWLNNGDKFRPKKLIANQPYRQWASTRFKMQLQCQYQIGSDCALQSTRGDGQVAVKTLVTLPLGLQDSNKKPVARYPLSATTPSIFQPTRYVNNDRATLHFEVEKEGVDQMIDQGAGRYRGDVTVIWDSSV